MLGGCKDQELFNQGGLSIRAVQSKIRILSTVTTSREEILEKRRHKTNGIPTPITAVWKITYASSTIHPVIMTYMSTKIQSIQYKSFQ